MFYIVFTYIYNGYDYIYKIYVNVMDFQGLCVFRMNYYIHLTILFATIGTTDFDFGKTNLGSVVRAHYRAFVDVINSNARFIARD